MYFQSFHRMHLMGYPNGPFLALLVVLTLAANMAFAQSGTAALSSNAAFKNLLNGQETSSRAGFVLNVEGTRCKSQRITQSFKGNSLVASTEGASFFRGTMRCAGQAVTKVAISRIESVISFDFVLKGRFHGRAYTLSFDEAGQLVSVQRAPGHFSAGECSGHAHTMAVSESGDGNSDTIELDETIIEEEEIKVVNFGILADRKFFRTYKNRSTSELLATINAVNAIYESDLGIRLNPKAAIVFRSDTPKGINFGTADADILLDNLVTFAFNFLDSLELDIVHFVTGGDIFDSFGSRKIFGVAGVAFVGTACNQPVVARGIIEDAKRSLRRVLLAHEIGHNFGATHGEDEGTSSFIPTFGIMSPAVSAGADSFSNFSRSQVAEHNVMFGDCLKTEDETLAIAAGSRLKLKRRVLRNGKVRLTATLTSATGDPIEGEILELRRVSPQNRFISAKQTDSNGRVRIRVKLRGDEDRFQARVLGGSSAASLLTKKVRIK